MRGHTLRVSFSHMPGLCAIHPNHDGAFCLTTGSDSTIRPHDLRDLGPSVWWRSDETPEPELPDLSVSEVHAKPINALCISPNSLNLATGSDDGFVRIFSLKAGVKDSQIKVDAEMVQACARFGGGVRALDFSPTGAFAVAGGEEPGLLKLIMTAQPSNVTVMRAPKGPAVEAIVALAYDPCGDFVASVGEGGKAVVWDVEKLRVSKVVDLRGRSAKCVAWMPGGKTLIFGTDRGPVLVSRGSWEFESVLEDEMDGEGDDDEEVYGGGKGREVVVAVAWSKNGRYLAAGREDSGVVVWDMGKKKVLACWKGQEVAQKLFWHPKANAVVLIDRIGHWGVIPDPIAPHLPQPWSEDGGIDLPGMEGNGGLHELMNDLGDEEEEGDPVKKAKGVKLKRMKQKEKKKRSEDAKAKRKEKKENGSDNEGEGEELENGFTFNASDVDADDEEDSRSRGDDSGRSDDNSDFEEDLGGEYEGLENGGVQLPAARSRRRLRGKGGREGILSVAPVQAPFVPTSTPLSEKKLRKKRILAWNLVGAVLSFDESTHDVVEVEFADASKRTIGIKDHFGYTMGCLSEVGVLLGSPKKKEHGCLLTFRPFSSWSNNSDWTQFLHPDEDLSVIALGQRFAAAVTTPHGLVRVFSLSGIQTAIFGVQGHIVTAAAGGDSLVIVYAEAGSAVLKCEVIEVSPTGDVERVKYCGNLMMGAGSRLEWVGFSRDSGELCSYDSNGWVWMLTDVKKTKRWVPVVQGAAKLGECDWFWVSAVTSTQVVGVACLSNERHPPAKPRPALRSLLLSAPVIEKVSKSGKAMVIERYLRTKMKLDRAVCAKTDMEEMYDSDDDEVLNAEDAVARIEVEADKCLLAMMEDACRKEHNMRALDLATRLHSKVSFKYAIELARHFKRESLVTRVEEVALRKIECLEAAGRVTAQAAEEEAERGGVGSSPVTPSRRASEGARHEEKSVFRIDDVTDDEEDGGRSGKTNVGSEDEADARESEVMKEEEAEETQRTEGKGRKRGLGVQESQASVKGGAGGVVKKARTTVGAAARSNKLAAKAGKRAFRNRFLKK